MPNFIKKYSGVAIAWLVAVILSIVFLPNMSTLVSQKGQTKIPSNMQSQVAQSIQGGWGHNISNTTEAVIVFNTGNKAIDNTQQSNINSTIQKLRDNKNKYGIKGITAPFDNAATQKQLVSKDKTTELVQLNVTKDRSIQSINQQLSKSVSTEGVYTYVTGGDILNDDFRVSTENGIKKTEVIAAIFILIVLILVFRSPVVPLISLLTVGVSLIVSLSIVMNLVSAFNFPLSNFTRVFLVVVLFGIGTDYNILLYNQFKEELSRGKDNVTATIHARKVAGKTILFSGLSVLIGFATLGLANFSIYRSAVGVAVGVAVLLLVLTTLNPFFMSLLGKNIFWPSKNFNGEGQNKVWKWIASVSTKQPIIALVVALIVTVPFMVSYHNNLNYDDTVELHNDVPSKQGLLVVQGHFSKGTAEPSTVYIKSNHRLDNEKDLNEIDRVTTQLSNQKGIKTAASVTQPSGMPVDQLYVSDQLGTLTNKMGKAKSGLNKINKAATKSSFDTSSLQNIGQSAQSIASSLQSMQTSTSGQSVSSTVKALQKRMAAVNQPLSVAQTRILTMALQQQASQQQAALSGLQGIASDTQSIGNDTKTLAKQLKAMEAKLKKANKGLKQIGNGMGQSNEYLKALGKSQAADTFYIPNKVLKSDTFKESVDTYLSQDKKTAKITLVLNNNPSSETAMNQVNDLQSQVEHNLKGTSLSASTVAIGGQTSNISDTRKIASSDFMRTAIIMVIGITVALMVITRSILQPLYILGTLLFAYVASLGITKMISGALLGQNMLTWNTPFFTFVMLIALGVDYSIFLMMKYREYHNVDANPAQQIIHACSVIGTVVISAAVILGGTFAALMPSGVLTLIQVAMGVIVGLVILVIIIPITIPSFIQLTYGEGKHRK